MRAEREVGSNLRAHCLVLFEGRPDEGNDDRPTSAEHLLFCDTHVHFHMPMWLHFFALCAATYASSISGPMVLRLYLAIGYCAILPIIRRSHR